MSNAIDQTHLSANLALAEDLTTVVAAGATAKEAYEAAAQEPGRHFLYQVPATIDLFVGYAI